jgi:hypothetical protein
LDEYFKRDLSEAEEDQLAQILAASPEEALRYTDAMDSLFRETGLPEPKWKKRTWRNSSRPFNWQWVKVALLGLATLATLALSAYLIRFLARPLPGNFPLKPDNEIITPDKGLNRPAPAGRTYEQLSVKINNPEAGLATVKVMNADNALVKTLFAGILPQGPQTFNWDGKTQEGASALPGTYTVEVKSGSRVLHREVHLEKDDQP